MATAREELIIDVAADIADLKKGLSKGKREMDGFGKAAKKLGGVLAGVFAVSKIADFVMEASKLAGVGEGVRAAFSRIGGAAIFEEINEAVAGTVSELDLMKQAVLAKNLGLPIKELGTLFEFATKRAQDTGESVDFLTDSIVKGIGRKSPLILDNLGISAIALKEALGGVSTEAASVAQVTEAVGKIAKQSLKESGKIIETAAVRTARWNAQLENVQESIGRDINRVIGALGPSIDSMISGAKKGFKEIRNSVIGFANEFIKLQNQSEEFRVVISFLKNIWVASFKVMGAQLNALLIEPLKVIGRIIKASFTNNIAAIPGIVKQGFKNIANDVIGSGVETFNAFKKGIEDAKKAEPIPLISLEEQAAVIPVANMAGQKAGESFAEGFDFATKGLLDFGGGRDIAAGQDQLSGFNELLVQFTENNNAVAESILGSAEAQAFMNEELKEADADWQAVRDDFVTNKEATDKWQKSLEGLGQQFTGISADLFNLALSGQKSIGALINKMIDLAFAAILAKGAIKGIGGIIGAGIAVAGLKALVSSTIGKQPEPTVRGDQIQLVGANTAQRNDRVF